jgi:hypothetical protein
MEDSDSAGGKKSQTENKKGHLFSSSKSEEPEVVSGDIMIRKKAFNTNMQTIQKEVTPH